MFCPSKKHFPLCEYITLFSGHYIKNTLKRLPHHQGAPLRIFFVIIQQRDRYFLLRLELGNLLISSSDWLSAPGWQPPSLGGRRIHPHHRICFIFSLICCISRDWVSMPCQQHRYLGALCLHLTSSNTAVLSAGHALFNICYCSVINNVVCLAASADLAARFRTLRPRQSLFRPPLWRIQLPH